MKLVNYQLQTQIESLSSEKSTEFFADYIRTIIEDNSKPYHQRADYVGLSLNELKSKIDFLAQDIQELQQLKKKLTSALDIAKEVTASVFEDNGVDRIDGNIISSLTLTKPSVKTKTSLVVTDAKAVMRLGYIKYEPDIEEITLAMKTVNGFKELDAFVSVSSEDIITPAKIKINTKRSAINTQADELLNLVEAAA
ncbi:siphovirus Gp157 family protein [Sulfurimonas sp. SAG-AH-194-I05]|nr:siphovirus Gp157 family protein [Sulfurimonas sp. SAG-AH-194-I05]MDF1875800.1 siphovirus Gp157 family protein [Sulfurimonas sp. SAG-AH-194-I05]